MRLIIYISLFWGISESAKILGVFPLVGKSHYRAGLAIMKILAGRGHHVTMVSPWKTKDAPENWTDVVLTPNENEKTDFFKFSLNPYMSVIFFNYFGPLLTDKTLSHPVFKKFVKTEEKFDAIILEQFYSDGLIYLGTHFDTPLILYSAQDSNSWTNPIVGNPAPPSYVADLYLPYSNEMTFFERIENTVLFFLEEFMRNFVALPDFDKLIKKHFPGAADITEYHQNVSLVLLNGDLSVNEPNPKVPSMVSIGGFHLSPSKPLSADLQKVLDDAEHGVVYFSMGSNLRAADMPKENLKTLISVFSTLKQTVIWKWEEEDLPGKPENVVVRKWFPQNDILAHKNVKLFITHGGIFSSLEAVHHGVPCLALPVFGDQFLNAKRATSFGYARWLSFYDMTRETLKAQIDEMLSNPKYLENARKRSQILRDQPITPQEKLVFWVEYIIRHRGADHLKVSALKLNWFQYLSLDILAFVLISVALFAFVAKCIIRFILVSFQNSKIKAKTQ